MYLPFAFGLLLGLAACTTADVPSGVQPVITDSAGVRIVTYKSVDASRPSLLLANKPFIDIGGLNNSPTAELDNGGPFLSATPLSDGRIAVADNYRVAFFDSTGKFLGSAGKRGSGPGEFQQIGLLCSLAGDTLLTVSENDQRILIWTSLGTHVRTLARPGNVLMESCSPNGKVIITNAQNRLNPGNGTAITPLTDGLTEYAEISPDGSNLNTLGRFPPSKYGDAVTYRVHVLMAGARIYLADPRQFELKVFDTAKSLRMIIRVTAPLPTVESEQIQRAKTSRRPVPQTQRAVSSENQKATIAAYRFIKVDSFGHIWVGLSADKRKWVVFDSLGLIVGQLDLPKSAESGRPSLAGVENDALVIRREDEAGATHLSFYKYRKSTQ